MIKNSIIIGNSAGINLTNGEYNVFLGDNAGNNEVETSFTFILKTDVGEVRKKITKEQWESFNEIIQGSIMTYEG